MNAKQTPFETIPHAVEAGAKKFGTQEAIVDDERRIDYITLHDSMLRGAGAFIAAGLKRGDRVAIWAPNGSSYIIAAVSVQAAGGCIVPLNTRFKAGEAHYILNKSRARFIVMADRFLEADYEAMLDEGDLPHLERRIVIPRDRSSSRTDTWDAFLAGAGAEARAAGSASLAGLTGDLASDMMFTSGTTGDPKGVVTTHAQNVRVYDTYAHTVGMREKDRYLVLYPFFHCAGYKAGWLASILIGATIYPEAVLEVSNLTRKVEAERITCLPGPPTLFQSILAVPPEQRADLSSVRMSITGSTVVPPALIYRMREELGIATVLTGYGLTETCGTVALSEADDTPETVSQSCGHAIAGMEVRCVDAAGKELPIGEAGEIVVRGYNVMQGYFEDPVATTEAIDADGWLHTGDIGILDERGYLRITDRKKDMYIVGGFNCYPAEIEKIMLGNPAYAQVAVIGVPDERMGEVGKAYVVLREGENTTPQAVIAWCREKMANYKVPRFVDIVPALPTNATGKVQKFRLKDA
jgi:acyl-CoA synthetase (AMP-forming)/AMP-acid ligase II